MAPLPRLCDEALFAGRVEPRRLPLVLVVLGRGFDDVAREAELRRVGGRARRQRAGGVAPAASANVVDLVAHALVDAKIAELLLSLAPEDKEESQTFYLLCATLHCAEDAVDLSRMFLLMLKPQMAFTCWHLEMEEYQRCAYLVGGVCQYVDLWEAGVYEHVNLWEAGKCEHVVKEISGELRIKGCNFGTFRSGLLCTKEGTSDDTPLRSTEV